MPLRDASDDSLSLGSPPAQPGHFGIGSAFINKHQCGERFVRQPFMPLGPFFGHVQPVLFGGEQGFFYRSSPVGGATNPPWKF